MLKKIRKRPRSKSRGLTKHRLTIQLPPFCHEILKSLPGPGGNKKTAGQLMHLAESYLCEALLAADSALDENKRIHWIPRLEVVDGDCHWGEAYTSDVAIEKLLASIPDPSGQLAK